VQINRFALTDFMEGEGLRLTDLHRKTKEIDPDGKGVAISFLSELLNGKKTEASAATVKKIADALNVRVRSLAANPNLDDLPEAVGQ
jgi:transcriptional regulator with XRE-family HTH domain